MKKVYSSLRVLILSVFALTAVLISVRESASAQCMSAWGYYIPFTVTNGNTTNLTNFQVKVVFNSAALIAAGQMNASGNDIRFTDSVCNNLYYWIDSGMNSTTTIIWVRVDYIPAGGNALIKMFYDNSSAPAASNGDSTFLLFDDFNTGVLNTAKWTLLAGAVSFSGSDITINSGGSQSSLTSVAAFDTSFYSEIKVDACSGEWPTLAEFDQGSSYNDGAIMFCGDPGYSGTDMYYSHMIADAPGYSADFDFTYTLGATVGIWSIVRAGGQFTGTWPGGSNTVTLSSVPDNALQQCNFGTLCCGTGSIQVDWFRARKYAPVIPVSTAGPAVANSTITTYPVSPTTFCAGTSLTITYSVVGSYSVGNVYTAQLSDSTGNFADGIAIGSVTATVATPITATIPLTQPHGVNYLVRVVSSTPSVTGSSNGTPLTINPAPFVVAVPSQTVCNTFATAAVSFTSSVSGTSFTWTNSNTSIGLPASGAGNIASFTATNTGASPIVGIIAVSPATSTCPGPSSTFSITVNPSPSAGTITGLFAVCSAAEVTLSDGVPGGVWNTTNGHAIVTSSGVVVGVSAGFDTVVYEVTNSCGTATTTAVVDVNASPSAGSISGASDVCTGVGTTLTDGAAGGVWSATNGHATVTAGGVVTGVTAGTDTIRYIVTNSCGTDTAYTVIAINTSPAAGVISGLSSVCAGSSISLTDGVSGGSWSATNARASVLGGDVTGITAGLDTIIYAVGNSCGTATTSATVTINPLPNAGTITGGSSVCTGSTLTLADAAAGGVWSASNGDATVAGGVVTPVSLGTDSIRYTVSNGCGTVTASDVITINGLPSAGSIVGLTSVCAGSIITLADAVAGGTWSASNTKATVAGGVVTGVTAGTDSIKYTVTNSCGTAMAYLIVTINPVPTAGSITGSSSVCVSSSITLSDATGGGTWSASNINAIVTGAGVVEGNTPGMDTIIYEVTNSCGIATASLTVTVDPLALASAVTGASAVCAESSITLTDLATGGVWSASNGDATVAGGVVTGVSAGTDSIKYTVSNACGTQVAYEIVTVNPVPNAGVITGTAAVCAGNEITLADAATGGIWTASNSNAIVTGTGVAEGITAGLDTISYTVSNSCGAASATGVVTVNASPVAGSITGASVVCAGSHITLTDAAPGGAWSASDADATVAGGVVTGVTAGADTIKYAVSNSCGTAMTYLVVTINPLPGAGSITGSSSVCAGSAITLADGVSGGAWSASNGRAIVSGVGVVNGVTAGTDSVLYTVTNSCGSVSASSVITIVALPSAGFITGSSSVCAGTNITLTGSISGGAWSASNSHATVAGGVVSGVSAGIDSIAYTVSNACGTATTSFIVTISPLPTAGVITGTASVCPGSAVTLADAAGGGAWSASNADAIVSGVGVVNGIAAGTDTITYTVTNSCGVASASKTVTVNPLPDAGAITTLGSSLLCAGGTVTLEDAATGGTWSASNANATVAGGIVTGITAGDDSIEYTVTNSCGVAMVVAVVTVNPLPDAGSITGIATVCPGSSITLADAAGGGDWSATNGSALVSAAGAVNGITAGTDSIVYTVTNSCGTAADTDVVTISPLPNAGAITGATASVCAGSNIALFDTASGGAWGASNGNADVVDGVVYGFYAGTDSIFYADTNSCGTALAYIVITVNPLPDAGLIMGATNVCIGSSVTLTDSVTGGSWTATNSDALVSGAGIVNGIGAGVDSIIYTVTNSCGYDADTAVVTVNALASAGTISGASAVCVGSNITLTDPATGGVWGASNGNATVSGGIVAGVVAGEDSIMYADTNSCGTALSYVVITINPMPAAGSISGLSAVCIGSSITLTDTTTGGVWTATNSNALVSSGGIAEGNDAGMDTIHYTVSNSCGSISAASIITVNPLPNAGVITGADALCAGSAITLTDAMSGGSWTASNGNATVAGGVVTGVTSGTDSIRYTVTNSCGEAAAYLVISVNPLPSAGSITGDAAICVGATDTLADATGGGQWTATNGNVIVSGAGVAVGLFSGMDTVQYVVANGCGTVSATFVVTINDFTAPVIIQTDSTLSTTIAYSTYQWFDEDTLIPGATNATYYTTDTGTYSVLVTNASGCYGVSNDFGVYNLAVGSVVNAGDISIYPNPVKNNIVITSSTWIHQVSIVNLLGQSVFAGSYDAKHVELSLADLPSGVYVVRINEDRFYRIVKE